MYQLSHYAYPFIQYCIYSLNTCIHLFDTVSTYQIQYSNDGYTVFSYWIQYPFFKYTRIFKPDTKIYIHYLDTKYL